MPNRSDGSPAAVARPGLARTGRALIVAVLSGLAVACAPEEGAQVQQAPPTPSTPAQGFRDVVEAALPSIVFIQTEVTPPPGIEQLLPGVRQLPDEPVPFGVGSGVLMSADGYILTNNHVVQEADRVRVVLHDRRHFEAEVIGRDPSTEVAVVRIQGNDFPVADMGDSDAVGLGDWVLALGSPLGLQFSVTAGVVSGLGRAVGILAAQRDLSEGDAAPLEHFIQTDAALSPGNSGGPLINSAGQVIGINTAVAAPAGVPGSVGFAIPSNLARRVAEQLIRHGEVRRPYLGVVLLDMTPAMAAAEGLERVEGAVAAQLEPGGPADAAGLRPGDLIVEIAGEPVQTVSQLQERLVRLDPGDTVMIRVLREGRPVELEVQLGVVTSGVGPTV